MVQHKEVSEMKKPITMVRASLILATILVWQGGQAAEKPTKDAAPKAAPKATSNATANAAKAFDAVSKELYPKAKQEGNLIIYSVWDVEHLRGVTDAFMKRYPGIKATYWQGRNPEIVTRVLTELQGAQSSVDVILSDNAPPVIRAAGGIMPYDTVQRDVLVLHDPTLPTVSLQIQALSYNTKKIKPADLPKSWKDEARFNNFVKGLKALNVPVHKSTSAMFRLVISGEYAICMPALLHDVFEEKGKGTPVDYIKTVPPVVFPRQAGIYAKAPHPNAAKLFAEWAISTEGQQVIDSVGRESSRNDFKSKTSIESAFPKGTKPVPVTGKLFLEDPKKWLDTNVKPIWEG